MEIENIRTDRRSFLTGAGKGASVLAMAPLLASVMSESAKAAPAMMMAAKGKFDFDTPLTASAPIACIGISRSATSR